MREIPKKNYIIFAFVIVVSIGIILYCMRWYTMSQSVDKSNVMDGVVSELKSDELSSYLLDNPNVIVYLAPSDSDENKSLEDELQNLIVSKNLTNEFIYLDSSLITDNRIYEDYGERYFSETLKNQSIDLSVTPNLWYFHDGKITDVMNTVSRKSSIQDVEYFLEKNGVY